MSSGRIERYSAQTQGGGLARWLPGLRTLRQYELVWLRNDVVDGARRAYPDIPVTHVESQVSSAV